MLRMDHVDGILDINLNGRPAAPAVAENSRYEIELTDLHARNVLVLEIEVPDPSARAAGIPDEWGLISLVVQTREPDQEK